jgi:hypothetical protein
MARMMALGGQTAPRSYDESTERDDLARTILAFNAIA